MDNLEDMIDNDLKKIIEEVRIDLIEITGSEDIKNTSIFDEIDSNIIDIFLEKNELNVKKVYRDNMKTIFSLAKYLQLLFYQNDIHEKVKKDLLNTFLDKDPLLDWYLYDDFTNQIQFTKSPEINSETKPQNLLVKFRMDKETNNIIYTLVSGTWGWDLTKYELKALLNHNITELNKNIVKDESDTKFLLTTEDKSITVNAGNIKISITKQ